MADRKEKAREYHADGEYDREKVDEIVLALLHLTKFDTKVVDGNEIGRAWKGQDWDVLNRLHEKGYIADPRGKSKSVVFVGDGCKKSAELFEQHFKKAR